MTPFPYIHRDISWLDFNYRVLQEAKDINVPLFERIKFLAIYSSNLDEFFRVRVATLRSLVRAGKNTHKGLDFEPSEILEKILGIVNEQQLEFSKIFEKNIVPELKKHNIHLVRRKNLNKDQIGFIETYFNDFLLPYAQPVLLVEKRIKPFLNNAALYLALHMKESDTDKIAYSVVKVPSDHLPRFIQLPSKNEDTKELILLGDIVRHNIRKIFPGYDIINSYSIKLTRDAELYIDDEYAGDLIDKIKKSLNKRNIGQASRLVYDRTMPKHMLEFLMNVFELSSYDLLPEGRYHNNSDLFKLPDFGMTHLRDVPLPSLPIKEIENCEDIFSVIRNKDVFIHVPYQSYESVIRFFEDAAKDPDVTHIKIIQYRVGKVSRIMDALKLAVKNGKQVSSFIEVKARFDEEANLKWGEELESCGVVVHYSMPGLKVHSKMAIVRRIEQGKPKIYAYTSTGNFHEGTAKIYSDIGIFTADQRITSEATRVFSFLETKKKPEIPFVHLGVGLFNLKEKFIYLIEREIANAEAGKEASLIIKLNSLQDKEIISLIYRASNAGVKIKLIIRGICSLVAGLKGVSDNIYAVSIVDRYLEHARVFIFHNDGNEEIFFSSADWMERNLHFRVETLIPVFDPQIKEIIKTLMQIQLLDNVKSRKVSLDHMNEYAVSGYDLAIRSQIETYYYIKRITENSTVQKNEE